VLLDTVDEAQAQMRALSSDEVGNGFRVEMAQRLETQERSTRGLMYRVFGQLADPPDETGNLAAVIDRLWARLRITPNEIKRRMKVAAKIGPRRQLAGPPLPPQLAVVARAVERGEIGEDHLQTIVRAMEVLPSCVTPVERGEVETSLVAEALKSDADIVKASAKMIDAIFNPDGDYDEADRARRRAMVLGPQGRDGMSKFSGWVDPEARCYVETCAAAVRPGRHRPDGSIEETPDDRSAAQRCHDGLKLGLKAGIASGELGAHRGHAVTVIARTTLAELNQAAHAVTDPDIAMPGPARTGGHTAVPMRDLIRMATDAIHYLAVFDDHSDRPLYLGRQKRIATADQRIICYARDGGCTRPDCTESGYHCEVHHGVGWAAGGATDADLLFFGCGPDHQRLTNGDWHTVITDTGRLAWTDGSTPPQINHAHHPDELLHNNPDPPPDTAADPDPPGDDP
jgi:hypothetical protein